MKPVEAKPKQPAKQAAFAGDSSTRKTIIIAHAGGNFGPNNSMKNFKGAIANKCEGIEFDVSTSLWLLLPFLVGLAHLGQHPSRHSWRSEWRACWIRSTKRLHIEHDILTASKAECWWRRESSHGGRSAYARSWRISNAHQHRNQSTCRPSILLCLWSRSTAIMQASERLNRQVLDPRENHRLVLPPWSN